MIIFVILPYNSFKSVCVVRLAPCFKQMNTNQTCCNKREKTKNNFARCDAFSSYFWVFLGHFMS